MPAANCFASSPYGETLTRDEAPAGHNQSRGAMAGTGDEPHKLLSGSMAKVSGFPLVPGFVYS